MDGTRTYQLGGQRFWVAPDVTWFQDKLLWPVTKKCMLAGDSFTMEFLLDLVNDYGARIAAIILIVEGQSQGSKMDAGLAGVEKLEDWIEKHLTSEDLMRVVSDFFGSGQMIRLVRRRTAFRLEAWPMTGTIVSSPSSPEATSPRPNGSGSTDTSEPLLTISKSKPNVDG